MKTHTHTPVNACQSTKQVMRSKEEHPELRDRIISKQRSGIGYGKVFAAPKIPKSTEASKTQNKEETKKVVVLTIMSSLTFGPVTR